MDIKITVVDDDRAEGVNALDLDPAEASRRDTCFFETPDLTWYAAGLVVRARIIDGDNDDSTVKIRPDDPKPIDCKWRDIEGSSSKRMSLATGL